jgi:benzoyl-CoA reductase/2-hydroxyglutaryl-CoA dehydratase subunit BcrC/BadD/HgdB
MLNARYPPGTKVGMTTTIPVEVLLAAGLVPVDLNNLFINSENPYQKVSEAEEAGFPRAVCAWIKGIYTTLQHHPEIPVLIVVTQGDCSNTHALMELLQAQGRQTIPFQFPYPRDRKLLQGQIEELMRRLGTDRPAVDRVYQHLASVRGQLSALDRLTWQESRVRGGENFQWLINSSDFDSDLEAYEQKLTVFLEEAKLRPSQHGWVRLGVIGIPPIFSNLFDYLETLGAEVVYNEFPRQFSMPYQCEDITDQYLRYTYPYDVFGRITDISQAIVERRLDGLIHYTQSFCFRQMQDLLLRERVGVPILTIEGDRPTPLDHRTRMRLEAFVDVLRH